MKSRVSRFSRVLTAFVYLSSVSYFATTENQILHAYKDWTGLISTDDSIISSKDISVNMSEDMAVSNDTPASSDNDNEEPESDSFDSFDSFVSHDTNDTEGETEKEADTEDSAEDSAENTGNTLSPVNPVAPVAPVASGPDTPSEATPNNPNDSESIAILTTRLTSDHHLIATLSISGVMGADVAVFPASVTGHSQENNNNATPDLAGGNIYTVANAPNTAGSYPAVASDDTDNADNADKNVDKPDSLLLNFENEEGVVESVRLWLDNEIDETVILDGITASNDNVSSADFSSRAYDGNISQPDLPRLAVPLSDLSYLSSSDLAAISDASNTNDVSGDVNTGYALDWFIGLDQLKSPIIVILPSTNEYYYFADGRALAAYKNFDQEYKISEIRATTRAEIEVRLDKKIRK